MQQLICYVCKCKIGAVWYNVECKFSFLFVHDSVIDDTLRTEHLTFHSFLTHVTCVCVTCVCVTCVCVTCVTVCARHMLLSSGYYY
jgi:hypothetical protein